VALERALERFEQHLGSGVVAARHDARLLDAERAKRLLQLLSASCV
jgi:hypothetical protein